MAADPGRASCRRNAMGLDLMDAEGSAGVVFSGGDDGVYCILLLHICSSWLGNRGREPEDRRDVFTTRRVVLPMVKIKGY